MKKRILALLLCMVMAISVGACNNFKIDKENKKGTEDTEKEEPPYVVELSAHDDFSAMLTGDYAINEYVVLEYYYMVMYGAGLGLVEVTNRDVVQAGDIVLVDYKGYVNGEAFSNGEAKQQWIDVTNNCGVDVSTGNANGSFIKGFTDGLVGAKKGEKTSSNVVFPSDYGKVATLEESQTEVDLSGQNATFEFTVSGIYQEVTPDTMTDEFVATNLFARYGVSTVDEFMTFLKEDLVYVYVMNYVLDNSEVEIPETYLARRLDDYYDYLVDYYGGEAKLAEFLEAYNYTLDDAKADWMKELEGKITEEVIFAEMVESDGLSYDEEGHNEYIKSILAINKSFSDEDSIYQYTGLGDSEAGKAYLMNQRAVRDSIIAKYRTANQ